MLLLLFLLLELPLFLANSNGENTGCDALRQDFGCTCHTGNGYKNGNCRDYHYDDPIERGLTTNKTVAAGIKFRCSERTMGWVKNPTRTDDFSLRIGDCAKSDDKTSYTPGEFLDVHLRSLKYNRKLIGLVLYAVDENEQKIGEWDLPQIFPMKFRLSEECGGNVITHGNGDRKNYHHIFHFRAPPTGTGNIYFRALIKEGGPNVGIFWWPNVAGDIKLTEGPQKTQKWVRGQTGQSCTVVCGNSKCDAAALTGSSEAKQIEKFEEYYTSQRPLLCSTAAYAPSSGGTSESFAFYHSEMCPSGEQPSVPTCEAVSTNPLDGSRLCPCGSGGAEPDNRNLANPSVTCVPEKPSYTPPVCGYEGCEQWMTFAGTSRAVPTMLASLLVMLVSGVTGMSGSKKPMFFGMLFATFGLARGHNWLNSPSRSMQASTVQPCRARTSDLPHVQVNPGMKFEYEWATGHGGDTYVLILRAEDFTKLYGMNRRKIDEYIALAKENGGISTLYKEKLHVVSKSKVIADIDMKEERDLYEGEIAEDDPEFIKRSLRLASKNVRADYKLLKYKASQFTTGLSRNDGGWEWVNNHTDENGYNWNWLKAVYKWNHVYSRASEWDIAEIRVPRLGFDGKEMLGDFIAHYKWGGYYDCIDIQVIPTQYPVTVDNMYGETTGEIEYMRVDHCMFERYDSMESGCYEVVTSIDQCISDCSGTVSRPKSISRCAGVNILPIEIPPRVYHQEEWKHKSINWTKCQTYRKESAKEVFSDAPEGTHVCYAPRATEDGSGLNGLYTISYDPEDYIFYSTCYVKVDNRNFTSGYPQPVRKPDPSAWSFSGECVSCKDYHLNKNLPAQIHPVWTLADKCQNCDVLPVPAYEVPTDHIITWNEWAQEVSCDSSYIKDFRGKPSDDYGYSSHKHNCTRDGEIPSTSNEYDENFKCVKVLRVRGSNKVREDECQALAGRDSECSNTVMWRRKGNDYCACWKKNECCGECSPSRSWGGNYPMTIFKMFKDGENQPDPNCETGVLSEEDGVYDGYCCSGTCHKEDGTPVCRSGVSKYDGTANNIKAGLCNAAFIDTNRLCSENSPPCVTSNYTAPTPEPDDN